VAALLYMHTYIHTHIYTHTCISVLIVPVSIVNDVTAVMGVAVVSHDPLS